MRLQAGRCPVCEALPRAEVRPELPLARVGWLPPVLATATPRLEERPATGTEGWGRNVTGKPVGYDRFGHAKRVDVEVARSPQWRALRKIIGLNIKSARGRRDVSASELAAALGSCRTVIFKWERGEVAPHLKCLLAISLALDCPLSELIPQDARRIYA